MGLSLSQFPDDLLEFGYSIPESIALGHTRVVETSGLIDLVDACPGQPKSCAPPTRPLAITFPFMIVTWDAAPDRPVSLLFSVIDLVFLPFVFTQVWVDLDFGQGMSIPF